MNRLMSIPAVAITLVVAACGSSGSGMNMGASPSTETAKAATSAMKTANAAFNDADVVFAQGMIPHHQQAVAMAALAFESASASSTKVRDLATRIRGAQDPEIQTMTKWLVTWSKPMMAEMPGMAGMMSAGEMAALGKATGAAFDQMWLTMMIKHHQGAITMANAEMASGANPAAIALATHIVDAQQAEIAEMSKLKAG